MRLDTAAAWPATRAWLVSVSMLLLVSATAPRAAAAAVAAPQVAPREAAAATLLQCSTGLGSAAVRTLEPAYPELTVTGTALGEASTSLGLRSAYCCLAHSQIPTSAPWQLGSLGVALSLETCLAIQGFLRRSVHLNLSRPHSLGVAPSLPLLLLRLMLRLLRSPRQSQRRTTCWIICRRSALPNWKVSVVVMQRMQRVIVLLTIERVCNA